MSPPARAQRTPRFRRRPANADIGTCRRRQRPGPGMPCATTATAATPPPRRRRARRAASKMLQLAHGARRRGQHVLGRGRPTEGIKGRKCGRGWVGGGWAGGCVAPHVDHGSSPAASLTCRTNQEFCALFGYQKQNPNNMPHEHDPRKWTMVSITRLRMRPYRPYFLCARAPINSTSAGLAPCENGCA